MGQQSVGKTCLVDRYINSTFETAQKNTIGVAFAAKKVSLQTRSHTKNDFIAVWLQHLHVPKMMLLHKAAQSMWLCKKAVVL